MFKALSHPLNEDQNVSQSSSLPADAFAVGTGLGNGVGLGASGFEGVAFGFTTALSLPRRSPPLNGELMGALDRTVV
jgi:hypothetical protein